MITIDLVNDHPTIEKPSSRLGVPGATHDRTISLNPVYGIAHGRMHDLYQSAQQSRLIASSSEGNLPEDVLRSKRPTGNDLPVHVRYIRRVLGRE